MESSASNQGPVNALLDNNWADASSTRSSHRNLSPRAVYILLQWLRDHCEFPYPSEVDKVDLIQKTELTHTQINDWFVNARRRYLPSIARHKKMLLTKSDKMGGKKYRAIPYPQEIPAAVDSTALPINIAPPGPTYFSTPFIVLTNVENGLHLMGTAEDNNREHQPANHLLSPPANAYTESPAPQAHQAAVKFKISKFDKLVMVASLLKEKMDKEDAKKEAALRSNITT